MTYTKRKFATDLLDELARGYDVTRIARWCYAKYLDEPLLEAGLDRIMDKIYGMDAGPEFEISEAELRDIASQCLER